MIHGEYDQVDISLSWFGNRWSFVILFRLVKNACWVALCEECWLMSTCHFPLPRKPIFCYSFVCSVSEGVDPCELLHLGFLVFWQQVGFRQGRAAPGNCRKGGKWAGSSFSTFSSVLIASSSLYLQVLLSIPAVHCPAQPQKHSPLRLVGVTTSWVLQHPWGVTLSLPTLFLKFFWWF